MNDLPPASKPPETQPGATLLVTGVSLFILGLVIITAATFQFDLVKNHVFRHAPKAAAYVAAVGYASAIGGLLTALVYFIKQE